MTTVKFYYTFRSLSLLYQLPLNESFYPILKSRGPAIFQGVSC